MGFGSKKSYKVDTYTSISDGLKSLYMQKLLPLEENYRFADIVSPKMQESDFDSVPMVMLIGQYSTGKTSLIRYLLNDDYPGMRIGPEPTTDGFNAIMYGEADRVIPGNAVVSDRKKQFKSLDCFGNNFLNRFTCSESNNELLKGITIVDTPGILSGDKQTIKRGYDFIGVTKWFAERTDRIFLLFDAHKLDISDEFREVICALKPYDTKIRLILNKADATGPQQLMRVYGALMWALGKVIKTPEVTRVYIGSFWDQPLVRDEFRILFQLEQDDLFEELRTLPKMCAVRRLNDFIARARSAIINAHIVASLKAQMPMFGKEKKKTELIHNLYQLYEKLTVELSLSIGDFPEVGATQKVLEKLDFKHLKTLNPKLVSTVKSMLEVDIPKLLDLVPGENEVPDEQKTLKGGIFEDKSTKAADLAYNPFKFGAEEGVNYGANLDEWPVNAFRRDYDYVFDSLPKENDKLTGPTAREHMLKSKLPNKVLAQIWALSDIDCDGRLTRDEFALMNYLCKLKLEGHELPEQLPVHLKPPQSF